MNNSLNKVLEICTNSKGKPISLKKIGELAKLSPRQVARLINKLMESKKINRERAGVGASYSYSIGGNSHESKEQEKSDSTSKRNSERPKNSSMGQVSGQQTSSNLADSRGNDSKNTSKGTSKGEHTANRPETCTSSVSGKKDKSASNVRSGSASRRRLAAESSSFRQVWFRQIRNLYHPRRAKDSYWKAIKEFDAIMEDAAKGLRSVDSILKKQENVVIAILRHISKLRNTDRWKRDNGKYLLGLGNYLVARQWEREDNTAAKDDRQNTAISEAHKVLQEIF